MVVPPPTNSKDVGDLYITFSSKGIPTYFMSLFSEILPNVQNWGTSPPVLFVALPLESNDRISAITLTNGKCHTFGEGTISKGAGY